jgi:hypothetical protein
MDKVEGPRMNTVLLSCPASQQMAISCVQQAASRLQCQNPQFTRLAPRVSTSHADSRAPCQHQRYSIRVHSHLEFGWTAHTAV